MKNQTNIRTYSELKKFTTFEERFNYLKLNDGFDESDFGCGRYLKQKYYKSKEWENLRDEIILRDNACDLGIEERDVHSKILIHHMNPIDSDDVKNKTKYLKDPEYLISVSFETHSAIHFGNEELLKKNNPASRTRNDHCPWKK